MSNESPSQVSAARFEIRSTHHYAYRTGEWADLVTVTRHANGRQVYLVRFPDGASDFWPTEDAMAGYEFREKVAASA